MSVRQLLLLLLTGFVILLWGFPAHAEPSLASQTLVIYNTRDPDSFRLAQYYAARRQIPDRQVVGLKCADTEEIARDDYRKLLAASIDLPANFYELGGTGEVLAAGAVLQLITQTS